MAPANHDRRRTQMLKRGIGFRQQILQLLTRGLITHDLCLTNENALLVAESVHKSIGEKRGSVLMAVPVDVSRGSGLLAFPSLLHILQSHYPRV
jgi:hypothetical protein